MKTKTLLNNRKEAYMIIATLKTGDVLTHKIRGNEIVHITNETYDVMGSYMHVRMLSDEKELEELKNFGVGSYSMSFKLTPAGIDVGKDFITHIPKS